MDPQQARDFFDNYFYFIIAGSVIFGALIGLVPLLIGIRRGRRNLGILGFVVTVIDSGISPILGVITAIVFTLVLVLGSNKKDSDDNADKQ
ncbi:MAG: hypothetical protein KBD94_09215 [Pyrinomonadaceae bacterium]|nr:hypothetical protein [Pyrinomonadaceae bacterium]